MLSLPLGRHLASSETSPSDAVDAVVSVAEGREQSMRCRHLGLCSAAGLQAACRRAGMSQPGHGDPTVL